MGHHSKHPSEHSSQNLSNLPRVPLTLQKIKDVTGKENALTATQIQMQLDINKNSIQNLGHLLPFLVDLNMSNSVIDTLRDLGTCLQHLQILNVANCRLRDLDGLSAMSRLTELDAQNNFISDVFPCVMLHVLQILNLERNHISNAENLGFLSLCSQLQCLTLRRNPISTENKMELSPMYRASVWHQVPQIRVLDDEVLSKEKDEIQQNQKNAQAEFISQSKNSNEKPKKSTTPLDLLKYSSPFSILLLPGNDWTKQLMTLQKRSNSMVDELLTERESANTSASSLTRGDVLCGNLTKCLRGSRRLSSNLGKQNSTPNYPPVFDPQNVFHFTDDNTNADKTKSNRKSKFQSDKKPVESYLYQNGGCVVVELSSDEEDEGKIFKKVIPRRRSGSIDETKKTVNRKENDYLNNPTDKTRLKFSLSKFLNQHEPIIMEFPKPVKRETMEFNEKVDNL